MYENVKIVIRDQDDCQLGNITFPTLFGTDALKRLVDLIEDEEDGLFPVSCTVTYVSFCSNPHVITLDKGDDV